MLGSAHCFRVHNRLSVSPIFHLWCWTASAWVPTRQDTVNLCINQLIVVRSGVLCHEVGKSGDSAEG